MFHRAKLLIAEDEKIIALGMQIFLSEAGHQICGIAATAGEAVRLAHIHRPDLALLDVRLAEGSDGTDAARELRLSLGIPSILVTGHLDSAQAQQVGAIGLLKKPYDPGRLLEMITASLQWLRTGDVQGVVPSGLFVPLTHGADPSRA